MKIAHGYPRLHLAGSEDTEKRSEAQALRQSLGPRQPPKQVDLRRNQAPSFRA
jgi:hypothetical protein